MYVLLGCYCTLFGEYSGKITHWPKERYKTFNYCDYVGFMGYVTGFFLFWEPSWELFSVNKPELHSVISTLVISTLAKMIDRIFQEMSRSVNPKSNAFSEG